MTTPVDRDDTNSTYEPYLFEDAKHAIESGYKICKDRYPWVAYKGSKQKPISWTLIPTDCEAHMIDVIIEMAQDISEKNQRLDEIMGTIKGLK